MAYQALYRQWRPTDFSSMVSQEAVVATLRNQITTGITLDFTRFHFLFQLTPAGRIHGLCHRA